MSRQQHRLSPFIQPAPSDYEPLEDRSFSNSRSSLSGYALPLLIVASLAVSTWFLLKSAEAASQNHPTLNTPSSLTQKADLHKNLTSSNSRK